MIARDRKTSTLCRPVGDRHLAVPVEHDTAFRKAVQTLGYALRLSLRSVLPAATWRCGLGDSVPGCGAGWSSVS